MTSTTVVTVYPVNDLETVLGTGRLTDARVVQVDPPLNTQLLRLLRAGVSGPLQVRLQAPDAEPPVEESIDVRQVLEGGLAGPDPLVSLILTSESSCPVETPAGPFGGPCTWFHHPKPWFC